MKFKKVMKKPLIVESIQLTESMLTSAELDGLPIGTINYKKFVIRTLEGNMTCNIGDYVIRGVEGEFYPVRKDIFEKTYELIGNE